MIMGVINLWLLSRWREMDLTKVCWNTNFYWGSLWALHRQVLCQSSFWLGSAFQQHCSTFVEGIFSFSREFWHQKLQSKLRFQKRGFSGRTLVFFWCQFMGLRLTWWYLGQKANLQQLSRKVWILRIQKLFACICSIGVKAFTIDVCVYLVSSLNLCCRFSEIFRERV